MVRHPAVFPAAFPVRRPALIRTVGQTMAVLMIVLLVSSPGGARELAVERDQLVAVELSTIGLNPASRTPVVLLREPDSGDILPIAIGVPEAQAIMRALQNQHAERPQTHDLIGNVLSSTGAELRRVIIDELVNGVYLGALELSLPDRDGTVLVDSRPSDALALAARSGASIMVAPSILISGQGQDYEGLPGDQVVTAIGITVMELTADLRQALGLPDESGLLVSGVVGAAARNGLEAGDMILTINGKVPQSPMDFLELVQDTPPGEQASIVYWKNGAEQSMELGTEVPLEIDPGQPSIRL